MEKKLPIGVINMSYDPIFDNTQLIVRSDINKFGYAIYEKFIDVISFDNIFIDKNITFDGINYGQIECMESYKLIPIEIENMVIGDFSDFLVNALNCDTYICCILNTYYIHNYVNFKKYDNQHEMLIYGYNLENRLFYATDFFDYKSRSYQAVTFKDINYSFKMTTNAVKSDNLSFANHTTMLKLNQYKYRSINLKAVHDGLKRFLASESYLFLPDTVLGVSLFTVLVERLEMNEVNTKHLYFVYVHIAYMKERIEYIYIHLNLKYNELYYRLKLLTYKAHSLSLLALKINMTKHIEKIDRCKRLLIQIKDEYISVLGAYVTYLDSFI